MHKNYFKEILELYNLKSSDLSRICEYDRLAINRLIEGKALQVQLNLVKKLSNVLNFSIGFILDNEVNNAIKIQSLNDSRIFYINYYDYITLRLLNIIEDKFDGKKIEHILNEEFIHLFNSLEDFENKVHLLNKDKLKLKLTDLILLPTSNKTYFNKKIETSYSDLLKYIDEYIFGEK